MMFSRIFRSVISKTLAVFILMVLIASGIAILTSEYLNTTLTQDLRQKQTGYITTRVAGEREERIAQEERYLHLYAKTIRKALAHALYTLEPERIQAILKNLMDLETVRELDLYDSIAGKRYLQAQKNGGIHYRYDDFRPALSAEKQMELPLKVNDTKVGTLTIRYTMEHILNETEAQMRQEMEQFKGLTDYLSRRLGEHFRLQVVAFLLFSLLVVIVIAGLMFRFIKRPLTIVQQNLRNFFVFFRNTKGKLELREIDTRDEFGAISQEINANIQAVLDLHQEVENTRNEILTITGSIAEKHSRETGLHVQRVAYYSELLAKYYGLSPEETELVRDASTLHDIGKVAIPDAILNKMARLTTKEFEIMKKHALHGYNILKRSNRPLLKAAAIIDYEHHERYDGEGYPRGLKGEEIHPYGRIVGLADVFDALSSHRVYKPRWEDEKIFAYLREERGRQFDPRLVDIFFEHQEEFLAIREEFDDFKHAA